MNTKTISNSALDIIDQYKNFKVGNAICSVPYYNNRTSALRGALKVEIGKGSPKDIFDEIQQIFYKNKIDIKTLKSEELKTILTDNNLGLDCSAFAYYVLNEESLSINKGSIDKHLSFPYCSGLFGKIKCKIRPIENTDVKTFAHNDNSRIIKINEIKPGDIITMTGGPDNNDRDHILIINRIEYQNFIPSTVHYVHAVAWPTDGQYGHGIHNGTINIINTEKSIIEQIWIENDKRNDENYTHTRAKKSLTEIRRLNWF
jgi:signal peptidase I